MKRGFNDCENIFTAAEKEEGKEGWRNNRAIWIFPRGDESGILLAFQKLSLILKSGKNEGCSACFLV